MRWFHHIFSLELAAFSREELQLSDDFIETRRAKDLVEVRNTHTAEQMISTFLRQPGITSAAAAAHHTVTYSMKNLPSAKWSESKNTWWVVQGWSASKSNFRVSTQGFNLEPPAHYEIIILLAGSSQPGPAPNRSGPTGQSCRSGISFANTLAGICPHYVYILVEPIVVKI